MRSNTSWRLIWYWHRKALALFKTFLPLNPEGQPPSVIWEGFCGIIATWPCDARDSWAEATRSLSMHLQGTWQLGLRFRTRLRNQTVRQHTPADRSLPRRIKEAFFSLKYQCLANPRILVIYTVRESLGVYFISLEKSNLWVEISRSSCARA